MTKYNIRQVNALCKWSRSSGNNCPENCPADSNSDYPCDLVYVDNFFRSTSSLDLGYVPLWWLEETGE